MFWDCCISNPKHGISKSADESHPTSLVQATMTEKSEKNNFKNVTLGLRNLYTNVIRLHEHQGIFLLFRLLKWRLQFNTRVYTVRNAHAQKSFKEF